MRSRRPIADYFAVLNAEPALQRWLDIQRSLPGSARYISGTPHTTSDNASPTQLKGHVGYIVGIREWP